MSVTLHLSGELDMSTHPRVEALLRRVENGPAGPAGTLVLDLSQVGFVDCTGLGVLLRARARLGDRLRLRALPPPVARLVALTGTGSHFVVDDPPVGHGAAAGGAGMSAPARPPVGQASDRRAAAVQRAAAELAHIDLDGPLVRFVQRVVDLAAGLLPEIEGLGVVMADRAQTSAFTGSLAAFLDERQYDTGFGPCLHTACTGQALDLDLHTGPGADTSPKPEREPEPGPEPGREPVRSTGQEAGAWPQFAAVARRRGVRTVVCLPLLDGHRRPAGTLALYATGQIDDRTRLVAEAFTAHAGAVLANAVVHATLTGKARQLQEALTSRAEIEQAKGVLMALHGIDADAAFERLSRASQDTNIKLRVLAADIINRATRE